MDIIREQNDVGLSRGIDPDRGSRKSSVAEGTDRKEFAAIGRVGRIDVPSETTDNGLISRAGRFREFLYGHGVENPNTCSLTFPQNHLCVFRQIICGREQAGISSD